MGYAGDGGPARNAAFSYLQGTAADGAGNLFVADEANHRVRKVDAAGTVTTVAGTGGGRLGGGGFNGNDRPATQARLNRPYDLKVDSTGRLYVSDRDNHQVRVIDRSGTIRAVPGSGVSLAWRCQRQDARPRQVPPEVPQTGGPSGVAVDAGGDVYVAAGDSRQVVKVSTSGSVATVAGRPEQPAPCPPAMPCPAIGDGGAAAKARFARPGAVELSPRGQLYILDTEAPESGSSTSVPSPSRLTDCALGPVLSRPLPATAAPGQVVTGPRRWQPNWAAAAVGPRKGPWPQTPGATCSLPTPPITGCARWTRPASSPHWPDKARRLPEISAAEIQ